MLWQFLLTQLTFTNVFLIVMKPRETYFLNTLLPVYLSFSEWISNLWKLWIPNLTYFVYLKKGYLLSSVNGNLLSTIDNVYFYRPRFQSLCQRRRMQELERRRMTQNTTARHSLSVRQHSQWQHKHHSSWHMQFLEQKKLYCTTSKDILKIFIVCQKMLHNLVITNDSFMKLQF